MEEGDALPVPARASIIQKKKSIYLLIPFILAPMVGLEKGEIASPLGYSFEREKRQSRSVTPLLCRLTD